MKTLKSVEAAEAVVKKHGRSDRTKSKKTMVYLIEARVELEHSSEFENESLETLNDYASRRIIDKGLVEGE